MRSNVKNKAPAVFTHEGAKSVKVSAVRELRRAVMANMLFEDQFYESGVQISERIAGLIKQVSLGDAAQVALDAREKFKLRHAPLFIVREIIRVHNGRRVGDLIAAVIQRPDEITELAALYWKDSPGKDITAQMKVGFARAFNKFNAYQLAKWDQNSSAVKLRDIAMLCHVRPKNAVQGAVFANLINKDTFPTATKSSGFKVKSKYKLKGVPGLDTPDTWETELSGGADKKVTFTRLMQERKLGAMALLRNLRNMLEAKVDEDVIREALGTMNTERVLPFRFISAAKYAPRLEDALEAAMFRCMNDIPSLGGKTALLIDHSQSMDCNVSEKSEITRFDAAAALAMILGEVAERCRVFTFSQGCVEIPPRKGFAMLEAVRKVRQPSSTLLGKAVRHVYSEFPACDRLIVITDEQSADRPPAPQGHGYIINVASNQHGIGYGPWVTIDGWSEAVIEYIRESEAEEDG